MEYQRLERQDVFAVKDRLNAENKHKADYIVPAQQLKCTIDADHPFFFTNGIRALNDDGAPTANFAMLELMRKAEENLSSKLNIPIRYHDMIKSGHLDVYKYTMSRLLERVDKAFMLRTFTAGAPFVHTQTQGHSWINPNTIHSVRSVLSDRYKRIENMDVFNIILQTLSEMKADVNIRQASMTENRLYLDVVHNDPMHFPDLMEGYRNPRNGNDTTGVVSGFCVRNSETGDSRFQIVPRAVVLACSNGITVRKDAMARTHLGSRISESGILWSDETHDKEMQLIIAQTRDAVRTFLSPEYLGQKIGDIAKHRKELVYPNATTKKLASALGFDEERTDALLEAFFRSNDMTTTGAYHAATWVAQTLPVEDQYEVEEAAFELLPGIRHFDRPEYKN